MGLIWTGVDQALIKCCIRSMRPVQDHHIGSQTAISQGKVGEQNNVAEMNRVLKDKYGVLDWTGMFS
jgi:hypothetical protein